LELRKAVAAFANLSDMHEERAGRAMGLVRTASMSVVLCCLLAACNTTDALTPRVGIGDDLTSNGSSPVTQNDTERMAAAQPPRVLGAETENTYHSDYNQQAYQPSPGAGGSSSATLDEQADALRTSGVNPQASRPLDDGQAPEGNTGYGAPPSTLSEQQEADRRLNEQPMPKRREPAREEEQQQEEAQQPEQPQPEQQASLPPAAAADSNTIRFLPSIGAPVEAVTPLSRQLGSEARARGLSIKGSGDTTSSYILKGYLSAFADGPAITVSYVWDVLDNSGARLHRIQGTQSVPLKKGDPWTAVPASVMQQIATKTMAEFTSWRATRGG
jgi:predicted small secreted protein